MPLIDVQTLTEPFQRHFDQPAHLVARAPGRVNLIGEHTDYNDGFVLPAAIDYVTCVAAAPRPDRRIRALAMDFDAQMVTVPLDETPQADRDAPWSNYLRGVVQALRESGYELAGADLLIHGNVPPGAGLSSSAALEMALIRALTAVSGETVAPEKAARLGQWAENHFVGCQCGIMDQLASARGRVDSALLIDCRSLELEPVSIPEDWALLIVESGVSRGLVDSEYNLRREQCEAVAEHFGATSLRDVSLEQLVKAEPELDPTLFRRAHHVLSENARTLTAARALREGDLDTLVSAMIESHRSMRDDFEITTPAIDTLVAILAKAARGRAGVRMTGGGFGGCVIALAPESLLPELRAAVEAEYSARTGCMARMIPARASAGAFSEDGLIWL